MDKILKERMKDISVLGRLSTYNATMVKNLCRGHFPLKKQKPLPCFREICVTGQSGLGAIDMLSQKTCLWL